MWCCAVMTVVCAVLFSLAVVYGRAPNAVAIAFSGIAFALNTYTLRSLSR